MFVSTELVWIADLNYLDVILMLKISRHIFKKARAYNEGMFDHLAHPITSSDGGISDNDAIIAVNDLKEIIPNLISEAESISNELGNFHDLKMANPNGVFASEENQQRFKTLLARQNQIISAIQTFIKSVGMEI